MPKITHLQNQYKSQFKSPVPNRYKNNAAWISKKLAENLEGSVLKSFESNLPKKQADKPKESFAEPAEKKTKVAPKNRKRLENTEKLVKA